MGSSVITVERGVAFFEDGTEVSNVSLDLVKAAPNMRSALEDIVSQISAYEHLHGKNSCPICPEAAIAAISEVEGEANERS